MVKFYAACVIKYNGVLYSTVKKTLAKTILRNRFLICFLLGIIPSCLSAQNIFSYTYQNVTRNNGGGTLEQGDIIEVRALVKVEVNTSNFYYLDTIRTGTQFVSGSLKIITNEGLTFRGPYTDASGDDNGIYISSGQPRLRVNLGVGTSFATTAGFGLNTGGGTVTSGTDKPKFYGKTLFVVAYRLLVTANFDDIINLTGNFYYDSVKSGTTYKKNFRFNYAGIKVIQNKGLCSNFSSSTFTAESDFGTGTIQNRALGATVPGYTKINLGASAPGDGYYSIANNTSGNGTTDDTGPYKPNPARVFAVWDILGDHTGSIDPIAGNPPTAAGSNGGYMLVVNSAYPTGEVYRDTIKEVCPNTYYEFSAWIRNICSRCSIDSNGISPNTPGVQPNLAFTINDVDYFTSGNIPYDPRGWVKRGFIYKTGPSETSFRITIKNNAPGGGGNDWVLDDIKLATCYPNLIMNPGDTAKVCAGSMVHLRDTVRSYFNNYVNYCWEKSINGGVTWSGTGVCGTKVPILKNGLWEYVVDTLLNAAAADSGNFYRLKVATTSANLLDSKCSVNNSQKVFLKVYNVNCTVLEPEFLSFNGQLINERSTLKWQYTGDEYTSFFEVERSNDGTNFYKIGSKNYLPSKTQDYTFTDAKPDESIVYYRLKLVGNNLEEFKYSRIVILHNKNNSFKISTVNPFQSIVSVNVSLPESGDMELNLCDVYGKIVGKKTLSLNAGNSVVKFENVGAIAPGMYVIRAKFKNTILQNKIFKFN